MITIRVHCCPNNAHTNTNPKASKTHTHDTHHASHTPRMTHTTHDTHHARHTPYMTHSTHEVHHAWHAPRITQACLTRRKCVVFFWIVFANMVTSSSGVCVHFYVRKPEWKCEREQKRENERAREQHSKSENEHKSKSESENETENRTESVCMCVCIHTQTIIRTSNRLDCTWHSLMILIREGADYMCAFAYTHTRTRTHTHTHTHTQTSQTCS